MNIVDSSGWIEYLADYENANIFEPVIKNAADLLVPIICVYEVFKRVLGEFGEERALEAMGLMSLGQIIELDRQIAINAALISNVLKLAMADSVILATARAHDATLWTQDADFAEIEGVRCIEKSGG